MHTIDNILVRKILNSAGRFSIEAEIKLRDGSAGIGSGAVAIAQGRRERKESKSITNGLHIYNKDAEKFIGCAFDQVILDKKLQESIESLGTDYTLAVSLAFARASAASEGISLVEYIRRNMHSGAQSRQISPMIPIFSGGIHAPQDGGSMQQMMLIINRRPFDEAVYYIREAYEYVEEDMKQSGRLYGYSASSGMLVSGMSIYEKFSYLSKLIQKLNAENIITIGVDVAAEHLRKDGKYHFCENLYTPEQFFELIHNFMCDYPLTYVEDPFDYADEDVWKKLYSTRGNALLFADDLSATQAKYVDSSISDGVIVKMKQVGTLSGTSELIDEVRRQGMQLCVSHRSIETEDTFLCDLAVATCAEYIKIGGPRRGDRVEKYNRLLRILGY